MDTPHRDAQTVRPPITRRLAELVHEATFEALPEEVVSRAKSSFLDTLGIALGGMTEKAPQILLAHVQSEACAERATVLGSGTRTTAGNAALVNGTAADIVGWSDISVIQMNHPSVTICPAVCAVGEEVHAPGKAVLLAHVLGVEVADKLGAGVKPGLQLKGWHPLAVLNTFGAAAACGRLLGLDVTGLSNALGIAGAEASGMRVAMGTMSKAYGAGRSARDGVTAAQLAKLGYTGPVNVIEGRDGFLQTFGDGASGEGILENFGKPYEFSAPGITLKKFPACTRSHNGIQGMLNLRNRHGFEAADVDAVECLVTPAVVDYLKFARPTSKFEAKYSMEFCLASVLLDGEVTVSSFTDERTRDPDIRALIDRITMNIWPEYAKDGYNPSYAPYGCVVNVTLKDGRRYTERVDKGPWEPETPPAWDDVATKFRSNARLVLVESAVEYAIEAVSNLEQMQDVGTLLQALARGRRSE